jgi:hypothetical protein
LIALPRDQPNASVGVTYWLSKCWTAIASLKPRVGKLAPRPLWRGRDHLGHDRFQPVPRGQVELLIVVAPIELTRRYVDC